LSCEGSTCEGSTAVLADTFFSEGVHKTKGHSLILGSIPSVLITSTTILLELMKESRTLIRNRFCTSADVPRRPWSMTLSCPSSARSKLKLCLRSLP
jgi:hypothetical protein